MAAAYAVCAAIVRRLTTGEGEHIDVAMGDILATWTGAATPRARDVDTPTRGVPGYGTFETADGRYLTLGVLTEDHFWNSLCDTLGLASGRGLAFPDRMARQRELQDEIADSIRGYHRDDLVARLMAADVPVAPVLDRAEMLDLAHFRGRDVVGADPWCESTSGHPVRFAGHPAVRTTPAPELDEHRGCTFAPRR
jgi:crotonobetainyl-CoA:carnitine CoA-transferase CaiB-like acyl-CoA transferase